MKRSPLLLSLALLGALSLSPLAAAAEKAPTAEQVCTALTKGAKKQSGKAAKGRLALAAAIKRLAKEPEDVNVRSKGKGLTPLMIAAALGEKDAVAWLLSIGADPTVKDADGKDAFDRTTDAAITELLKKGTIFSWDEAIAYLESIRPEDWPTPNYYDSWTQIALSRSGMLKHCREVAEGKYAHHEFLEDCTMLGLSKMVSFLFRNPTERAIALDCPNVLPGLPGKQWLPILNLYHAHQKEIRLGHPEYREEFTTNAKLCAWICDNKGWGTALYYGATGAPLMITAGLQSIKDSPTPVPAEKLQEELDSAIELCARLDDNDAKAGKAVNHHRLEAAKLLLQAGAQYTNGADAPYSAISAEMKKLLQSAAKKKQGK